MVIWRCSWFRLLSDRLYDRELQIYIWFRISSHHELTYTRTHESRGEAFGPQSYHQTDKLLPKCFAPTTPYFQVR